MSEKVKYILNLGAIIGLANGILPSLTIVILPIGLFYAIKKYRTDYLDNVISYGEVFKIGMRLSALAGIVIGFANLMWFYFAPQKVSEIMNQVFVMMENMGYPANVIEDMQQNQVQLFSVSGLLNAIVMGFFISLILGFILKKETDSTQQD